MLRKSIWLNVFRPLRSLAVGSGSMMCRVGSVVAPFCVYLADVWVYLPQVYILYLLDYFRVTLVTILHFATCSSLTKMIWTASCQQNNWLTHFFIAHLYPRVAHCRNLGLHHRSAHADVAWDPGTAAHDHFGRGWSSGKGAQKEEEPRRRRGQFGDEPASSQGLSCLINQRDRWEEDGEGWRLTARNWQSDVSDLLYFWNEVFCFFRTCWNVFVDVLFFKVTNGSVTLRVLRWNTNNSESTKIIRRCRLAFTSRICLY